MQITQPQESSSETNFDQELVQTMRPFFGHKSGTTVGRLTASLLAMVPVLCPENDRPPLAEILKPSAIVATTVHSTQAEFKSIDQKAKNLALRKN